VQPLKCQKKTTRTATVSLEAHRPSSSSDHVSTIFCTLTICFCVFCFLIWFCSAALDAEISISWH
jgi:hypothetical protein